MTRREKDSLNKYIFFILFDRPPIDTSEKISTHLSGGGGNNFEIFSDQSSRNSEQFLFFSLPKNLKITPLKKIRNLLRFYKFMLSEDVLTQTQDMAIHIIYICNYCPSFLLILILV